MRLDFVPPQLVDHWLADIRQHWFVEVLCKGLYRVLIELFSVEIVVLEEIVHQDFSLFLFYIFLTLTFFFFILRNSITGLYLEPIIERVSIRPLPRDENILIFIWTISILDSKSFDLVFRDPEAVIAANLAFSVNVVDNELGVYPGEVFLAIKNPEIPSHVQVAWDLER